MAIIAGLSLKAAGLCYCREKHEDRRPCPGSLKQEEGHASLVCTYCGTKYRAETLECDTDICNRCNGKCG